MSRYIDAEAWLKDMECTNKFLDTLKHKIADAPHIDIVFCKECKHCEYADMKVHLWCDRQERYVYADDFCSYGERESE